MRAVDIEKIMPLKVKEDAAERIKVFYEKDRRYKRHLDGVRVIKELVEPLSRDIKINTFSAEKKESIKRAIKESYKTEMPEK